MTLGVRGQNSAELFAYQGMKMNLGNSSDNLMACIRDSDVVQRAIVFRSGGMAVARCERSCADKWSAVAPRAWRAYSPAAPHARALGMTAAAATIVLALMLRSNE